MCLSFLGRAQTNSHTEPCSLSSVLWASPSSTQGTHQVISWGISPSNWFSNNFNIIGGWRGSRLGPQGSIICALCPVMQVFQPFPSTTKYKQGCMELTGFMDSPWSGSSFTFPSKSLVSKFTILYLIRFRLLLLSQDLMKINHQISV